MRHIAEIVFAGLLQHALCGTDGDEDVAAELVEELLRRGFIKAGGRLVAGGDTGKSEEIGGVLHYHIGYYTQSKKLENLPVNDQLRLVPRLVMRTNSRCSLRIFSAA